MKESSQKSQFVALRAKGLSYRAIAKEMHISRSTVARWQQDLAYHVKIAKQDEIDQLYEEYKLTQLARIKRLGIFLQKVEKELTERDFSDIPTDKLMTMYLNGLQSLSKNDTQANIEREFVSNLNDMTICSNESISILDDADPK